jgi:ABC-2 type transport system ATP-binding protein
MPVYVDIAVESARSEIRNPKFFAVIHVTSFHKHYGDTLAVQGLSFELPAGAILGLVGANGAGKTTTLRALAGIIPPTHGQLVIAGHDIVRDSIKAKSHLAYVPDDPKLFDELTVWEHLEFIAAAYRVADFKSIAEQLLADMELTEKRDALAQGLSRGMRQKVAIACAYLHEPQVILLDEPMTGLDPHGIRVFKASIAERAKRGAAIVLSSHLLSMVEDLCTHLLIVAKGQSLFCGTLDEARSRFPQMGAHASLEEIFFHATAG